MSRARRRLRRLAAVGGLAAALFSALGILAAPAASAHPLGNFTINRYSDLNLAPGTVTVTYVLDMAEIPTAQQMPQIDTNADGTATDLERQAWADRTAPVLLSRVRLDANGAPVALSLTRDAMTFRPGQAGLPIIRLVATFTGDLLGTTGSMVYRDANYPDRIGWKEITVHSADGVAVAGSSVPARSVSDGLLAYPKDLLQSPLDVTQATFSFHPGLGTQGGNAPAAGATVSGAPVASGGSFAGLVSKRLTPLVLLFSLGLAFVFGALHALGPGHGKTITAAYLVGAEARAPQAVVVGVVIALMHTASVLALGLVALVLFKNLATDKVYPWLGLITGLVALGLGGALLLIRLRARRRGEDPWGAHGHSHPWEEAAGQDEGRLDRAPARELALAYVGVASIAAASTEALQLSAPPGDDHARPRTHTNGHGHPHPHEHDGSTAHAPVSRPGLMALAIAGGILPSPTALVVLTAAGSFHRIGYGLGLILAFSVGLATALTVVGLLALRTRTLVSRRFSGRWASVLPLVSAAVIVGVGLFFTVRGVAQVL